MRKFASFMMCSMLASVMLIACATASEKAAVTLKIATVHPESSPLHQALMFFVEDLHKRTGGVVKVTVFPNSQLGNERDLANSVLMGSVEGAMLADSVINSVDNVPAANIGSVPFLFTGSESFFNTMDELLIEELNAQYAAIGVKNISYFHIGGNDIANSVRSIVSPDDMKGLKIRIWDNEGIYKFLAACGSSPVTMAFGEVYTAIQQGTVNGVTTNSFQFVPMKFVEVCKYHTNMKVLLNFQSLSFNKDWFDALPEDIQKAFAESGEAAYENCRDIICPNSNARDYQAIEAAGVKVTYLTDEQRQVFIDIGSTIWGDFRSLFGAELFDRIVAISQRK